jgi:peptidyl-dipeptidase A
MALTHGVSNESRMRVLGLLIAAIAAIAPVAIGQTAASKARVSPTRKAVSPAPTVAEAERFISDAESRLQNLWIKGGRASWVAENFITDDTEAISADAEAAVKAATADLARQARRYEKLPLPPDVARKFKLLKLSVDIPAPRDPAAQAELARIQVSLDSDYGKGTWCPPGKKDDKKENCKELPDIEKIMATSRNPQEL